jgi:hypothetical protein
MRDRYCPTRYPVTCQRFSFLFECTIELPVAQSLVPLYLFCSDFGPVNSEGSPLSGLESCVHSVCPWKDEFPDDFEQKGFQFLDIVEAEALSNYSKPRAIDTVTGTEETAVLRDRRLNNSW